MIVDSSTYHSGGTIPQITITEFFFQAENLYTMLSRFKARTNISIEFASMPVSHRFSPKNDAREV